ncbi:hypothetical protein MIND_00486400 [Mycena indigotica]|uniref:Uncharacterized protein n=1 Tax=Mycena indigotica TaxID=2126181 RepID=A0A8H6SY66_9AGAR|nr:uncharacterized protein MIND_00486400 [Mycena indigotica]KAF7306937.1 hypothetical protein MIND_00486400 [Mycena indigotica]
MSTPASFASFAAYTPPPDDQSAPPPTRPWFPTQTTTSYQSGGIPTFGASSSNTIEEAESQQNQWETRHGLRVDLLAALAYLFGPISALALLIVETQNDYVRFHAYQSALLTTPLVLIRILASLLQFPNWMRTLLTLVLVGLEIYMAIRAYIDASQNSLARFELPYVGPIAARWLEEE